jgi:tetratricopeptide (TPR) repeat protein
MIHSTTKLFLLLSLQCSAFYAYASDTLCATDSIRNVLTSTIQAAANDSLALLTAYYKYGEFLDEEGLIDEAIEQFEIAYRIAGNIENNNEKADIENYLAILYSTKGDYLKSIETYRAGLKSAELAEDYNTMSMISMNLAGTYSFAGNYRDAIDYALKSLKIKETHGITERICYHYITMGNIFRENNNIEKWKDYIDKAYRMKDVEGCASIGDIAKIYNCLGGIAREENKSELALLYYDTLLVISRREKFNQGISTALTNMSQVLIQNGEFKQALELVEQSEAYMGKEPYETIYNNNHKAYIFKKLGKYNAALDLVKKNFQSVDIEYHSTEKIKSLELMYELNYLLKNYIEAFRWNDSLRSNESRLRNQAVREAIEEMELTYETEKKEARIDLLEAENQIQTQRMQLGYAVIIILAIVILMIVYIYRIKRKEARYIKIDLQQKILRTQMKPHFIFNVLGSIQYFMLHNEPSKASGYLSQLASLMRSMLEYSDSDVITLEKEVEMLKNYIELEQLRMPEKFDYTLKIINIDEPDFVFMPPMLVQPFIENAINHGFKNASYPGILTITITGIEQQWVEFIIEDNGVGCQQKQHKNDAKHTSKAMEIFEKRRRLIQHVHGKTFSFTYTNINDVDPNKTGVRVEIRIPVIS